MRNTHEKSPWQCWRLLALGVSLALASQNNLSDERGRVCWPLEKLRNHALEETKALDSFWPRPLVAVDIDGSIQNKSEFLASIKSPDYQTSQAVTEQSIVQGLRRLYGRS